MVRERKVSLVLPIVTNGMCLTDGESELDVLFLNPVLNLATHFFRELLMLQNFDKCENNIFNGKQICYGDAFHHQYDLMMRT